ncbi:MAG TPA: hypothetical protein VFQ88_15350, partial [Nevskiaceae bacterium]|nr:hypothetical protein [Nevskiaceae bacterium]
MQVKIGKATHAVAVATAVTAATLFATGAFAANMGGATNMFGGPVYTGAPDLPVTVALVMAGGGPKHFSLVTALNHMLGPKTVKAEVGKLT